MQCKYQKGEGCFISVLCTLSRKMQRACLAISCVNSLSSVYPIVLKCLREDKGVSMHGENPDRNCCHPWLGRLC